MVSSLRGTVQTLLGLGVAGDVLGGWLFEYIAKTGTAGFNTVSALVAALARSAALLATFHEIATGAIAGAIRSDRIFNSKTRDHAVIDVLAAPLLRARGRANEGHDYYDR